MNQINNSFSSHGQPFSAAALTFLQNAWLSGFTGLGETIIGSSYNASTVYVLYGCAGVPGTLTGTTDFSAGYMFYNGEMFFSPAQPGVTNPVGGLSFVCNLLLTNFDDSAGTSFVDGLVQPIRQIRNIKMGTGVSGSGTLTGTAASDFNNLVGFGAWQTAPALTALPNAGLSVTITSTVYNRYKLVGNTLTWTFKVQCNITPGISLCSFTMSTTLGVLFQNVSGYYPATFTDGITVLPQPMHVSLSNITGGLLRVSCTLPSTSPGDFTSGSNNYFDITVIAEVA